MKFKSGTDEDVQIGLTSGHTAIVTAKGNELEKRFHKEAIARGCIPAGTSRDDDKVEGDAPFDKHATIVAATKGMLEAGNEADFTNDGRPKTDALSKAAGFTVSKEERDAAWAEIEAETAGRGDGDE